MNFFWKKHFNSTADVHYLGKKHESCFWFISFMPCSLWTDRFMWVELLPGWLWCKLGVKSIMFSCDLLNQNHTVSVTVRGEFEWFWKSSVAFHKYLSCLSFLRYSLNVSCSICFSYLAVSHHAVSCTIWEHGTTSCCGDYLKGRTLCFGLDISYQCR